MIGRFFFWLFHVHKWEIIEKRTVDYHDGLFDHPYRTGITYYLQCKECGKVKKTSL